MQWYAWAPQVFYSNNGNLILHIVRDQAQRDVLSPHASACVPAGRALGLSPAVVTRKAGAAMWQRATGAGEAASHTPGTSRSAAVNDRTPLASLSEEEPVIPQDETSVKGEAAYDDVAAHGEAKEARGLRSSFEPFSTPEQNVLEFEMRRLSIQQEQNREAVRIREMELRLELAKIELERERLAASQCRWARALKTRPTRRKFDARAMKQLVWQL